MDYFIQLEHRNSLDTWSNTPQQFTSSSLSYDFTSASSQAYGDNMIQVDTSPVKYAIYSGDVNQDGMIDGTDAAQIDNGIMSFLSGYVSADLTGDNFVDAADAAIADNNVRRFVSVIRP
jgi:hypothetical protein